jgi:hypothetical protein
MGEGSEDYFEVTVSKNLTITTELGTIKNCIKFYFDAEKWADDEHSYIFGPEIGLVKYNELSLMSYKLNSE